MATCPTADAPPGPWPWRQVWHGPAARAGLPWPDFDRAALDALLWTAGPLLAPDARLATALGRESFPRREGTRLRAWLRGGFLRGQTVVLDRLEQHAPPIAAWARALGDTLGVEAEVSAVLTPPGAQGYPLHRDASDVLVCQLQGCKHWRWHPSATQPTPRTEVLAPASLGTAPVQATVSAGEWLYLPGGVPHEASTGGAASLHLSVSLHGPRWLDLLLDLAAASAWNEVTLRQAARDDAALQAVMRFLAVAPEALAGAQRERERRLLQRTPPLAGGALAGPDTPFDLAGRWRVPPLSRLQVEVGHSGVTLSCSGHVATRLRAPHALEPVLRWLAARRTPFSAADLPPLLAYEEQCALVRQWVAEGLLEAAR